MIQLSQVVTASALPRHPNCHSWAIWRCTSAVSVHPGRDEVLVAEIIRDHSHYMEKGYIPIYAMENVLESYTAYHALGGNGTITKMVEELKRLPTRKENHHEG